MTKSVSALLFGASLLAAVPASAADYLTYTASVNGSFVDYRYNTLGQAIEVGRSGAIGDFVFTVPAVAGATTYDRAASGSTPSFTVTALPTLLLANQISSPNEALAGLVQSISVTLCGDFSGGIAASVTPPIDSPCSQARSSLRFGDNQTVFTGQVISYTISAFSTSQVVSVGFSSLPVAPAPEPATWMMMILGFATVASALRRQSKAAFA